MKHQTRLSALTLSSLTLVLAACSGGGGSGGLAYGTLSVDLMDAPVTDVDQISILLERVRLKPQGDGPAIEFEIDPDRNVDLLTLDHENTETLLEGVTVPAGAYNWIELDVSADFDSDLDSYVREESTGGMVEIRVPSGSVRLVSGFTVTANQETSFLIDWNTRMGLVKPPGQAGYLLRPAFRVIDMTEYGTLSGTVAMALITGGADCTDDDGGDLDIGNVVYVFAGGTATPDDIDAIDPGVDSKPNPVATIDVSQDGSDQYHYSTILSPGSYTLAFSCNAGLDHPDNDDLPDTDPDDLDFSFSATITEVTITDGVETVEDFL